VLMAVEFLASETLSERGRSRTFNGRDTASPSMIEGLDITAIGLGDEPLNLHPTDPGMDYDIMVYLQA